MTRRSRLACLLTAAVVAGCTSGAPVTATPTAPEPAAATPTAPATATAAPSASAKPTAAPLSSPTWNGVLVEPRIAFTPGQIAVVTAGDGVRLRTRPSVDDSSGRYTPLLAAGANLYVISGPVHGSGYHWYEVVPLDEQLRGMVGSSSPPENARTAWVAAASREGYPWLRLRTAKCPAKPRDVAALASLAPLFAPESLDGLACFGRVPITVTARILPCGCSVTGPCDAFRPSFFGGSGEFLVLLPPTTRRSESSPIGGVRLFVDPASVKGAVPIDRVVTVTGMFNHPAAAACQFNPTAGVPEDRQQWLPAGSCRTTFVVTSIK